MHNNDTLNWKREADGYIAVVPSDDDPHGLSRFFATKGYRNWLLTYPGERTPDSSFETLRECKEYAELEMERKRVYG
jgi:hypothetical protein